MEAVPVESDDPSFVQVELSSGSSPRLLRNLLKFELERAPKLGSAVCAWELKEQLSEQAVLKPLEVVKAVSEA